MADKESDVPIKKIAVFSIRSVFGPLPTPAPADP
jgi:hypothetical protein